MKLKEKEEARKLRKKGVAINKIAEKLNVSKGSVSLWVRDIKLTADQQRILTENMRINLRNNVGYDTLLRAAHKTKKEARKQRILYQQEGKELLKKHKHDPIFIAGIMLYWSEGSKCKNDLKISNSDVDFLKLFLSFLRKYFKVPNEKITFRYQWYSNNKATQEEVERYWCSNLGITKDNFRKSYIDYRPVKNMGRKKDKCPYGVGAVSAHSTKILHNIYGAVKEFTGVFNTEKWVF